MSQYSSFHTHFEETIMNTRVGTGFTGTKDLNTLHDVAHNVWPTAWLAMHRRAWYTAIPLPFTTTESEPCPPCN